MLLRSLVSSLWPQNKKKAKKLIKKSNTGSTFILWLTIVDQKTGELQLVNVRAERCEKV